VQPGLPLFTGFAKTRGFFIEGHGVFFHVEIPGVQPSVAWLVERLERDRLGAAGASRANMAGGRMFDPNTAYTLAVQQRLIDSMLKTSMDVGPDEWITIAAHDVDVRGTAAIEESITLMLRVKGSDLLDLRAGRLTLDEARKRIRVREF
jgi:hypothetical protein